jgi:OmcA/MtrC family decaheme c-type cytochrome
MIGNGSGLTADEIERLGKLSGEITAVTVSSPPVVDFTVTDANGDGALGLAPGVVAFTFAKLVPPDTSVPPVNGGLSHWQNYINVARTSSLPGGIPNAIQGSTDSSGVLEELGDGNYRYTFATDVTNVTSPMPVAWEPNLTHRVGFEIRLSGPGEGPLAPDNPVFDFVPDGGAGSGVTKAIVDTGLCQGCHYEFDLHGGPRKSTEYCVTCHNMGSVDPDTGNSVDFSHLVHSIHMGEDRTPPFQIIGYGGSVNDYGDVTFPRSKTYCETCHTAAVTADGDAWNTGATAKSCGGCHADGLLASDFDAVTGQAVYKFDHAAAGADVPIGTVDDGQCASCHLGSISTAGPPLAIHSRIRGDDRFRSEVGDNFVFEILGASNIHAGETPIIKIRVSDATGTPYDILNDPEFDVVNGAALNLYVAWATADYYGGDENGQVLGARQGDDLSIDAIQDLTLSDTGYPYRMYLDAIKDAIVNGGGSVNANGSYSVPFFMPLPADYAGDVAVALGGHPVLMATDADGVTAYERGAAVSAVFYKFGPREAAFDSAQCNACHKRIVMHGSNRNGNYEFCLMCHNGDAAVCSDDPELDGSCPVGATQEGFHFGRMIHSIHSASTTFLDGDFADVTFPQSVANCQKCHKEGLYNTARPTARAVSTNQGNDIRVWTDDIATTANAAVCGVCHSSTAARGHFESQGGQVDDLKCTIVGAECGAVDGSSGSGLPNGQEACPVCHGTGAEFETSQYHNPGLEE